MYFCHCLYCCTNFLSCTVSCIPFNALCSKTLHFSYSYEARDRVSKEQPEEVLFDKSWPQLMIWIRINKLNIEWYESLFFPQYLQLMEALDFERTNFFLLFKKKNFKDGRTRLSSIHPREHLSLSKVIYVNPKVNGTQQYFKSDQRLAYSRNRCCLKKWPTKVGLVYCNRFRCHSLFKERFLVKLRKC